MSIQSQELRSLGISAKSLHTLQPVNQNQKHDFDKLQSKKMRYALQRKAQSIMFDYQATKQHRVCSCSRDIASDGVAVYRSVSGSDARFSNLMTCGSVWACPVCAAKVTEGRRADLQAAIDAWVKQGGFILLMTLTFPHERLDNLAELLEKQAKALQYFKNSRTYKNTFGTPENAGEYGRVGSVRSLEVTHGDNGWHPHTHDLIFVKRDGLTQNNYVIDTLKQAWIKALSKAGLANNSHINDMWAHSLDIRGGDYAAEYVAKYGHEPKLYKSWSAAHEVTKQHSKASVKADSHATPFMLLNWAFNGDDQAAALFKEFVQAFDGKRMNYWSPNLRKHLGLNDELADEELAAEDLEPKEAEELAIRLDALQWKLVLETNARFEVLERAASGGGYAVLALLDDLKTRDKVGRGWFKDRARPDMSRFFR